MIRRSGCYAVALLLAFPLLAASAQAAPLTYTVPAQNSSDPANASCTASHVCASLRAAIKAANAHPGSTIELGAATYKIGHVAADAPNAGALMINATTTIVGQGAGGAGTIIEQTDEVSRVLTIGANLKVTLRKLELTGGHPAASAGGDAQGGGILAGSGTALTLVHVLVTGNAATAGNGAPGPIGQNGGIGTGGGISSAGSLTLTNSTVTHDTAQGGTGFGGSLSGFGGSAGGGGISASGPVALTASAVADNQAIGGAAGAGYEGGGVLGGGVHASGLLTVHSSTITGNSVSGGASGGMGAGHADGGGVDAAGPSTFVASTVSANLATAGSGGGSAAVCYAHGGGIASIQALTLSSLTVKDNVATGSTGASFPPIDGCAASGGGIFVTNGGTVALTGVTVRSNAATGGAGGSGVGTGGAGAAGVGGGIYLETVSATIRGADIAQNHATGGAGGVGGATGGTGAVASGAGIQSYAGSLSVTASWVHGNAVAGGAGGSGSTGGAAGSGHGGGIILEGQPTSATVDSSSIDGNSAIGGTPVAGGPAGVADGGGIADLASPSGVTAVIVNSTIAANSITPSQSSANDSGGGVSSFNGPISLVSDTVAGNLAGGSIGTGGNLWAGGHVTLQDTLIAGGSAAGAGGANRNCIVTGSITDTGHNLEDSGPSPSQCGLSAANHDAIVASGAAGLGSLASNGGPTLTIALTPMSPAIGAGGTCAVPTHALDQRGKPRHSPCDVGAFEHQRPIGVKPPAIHGIPALGVTLTCAKGTWTGDGLTFSYRWQRDASPIAGATGSAHRVTAADRGHTLICKVRASGTYGSNTMFALLFVPKHNGHASIPSQTDTAIAGTTQIRIMCGHTGPCVGQLRITLTTATGHRIVIGQARFIVGAGTTAKVTVQLTEKGRTLLAHAAHGLQVTATAGSAHRKVTLKRG